MNEVVMALLISAGIVTGLVIGNLFENYQQEQLLLLELCK